MSVSLTAVKKTYSATFKSTWNKDKMGAMVLVWRQNGGTDYSYVNGNIIEAK